MAFLSHWIVSLSKFDWANMDVFQYFITAVRTGFLSDQAVNIICFESAFLSHSIFLCSKFVWPTMFFFQKFDYSCEHSFISDQAVNIICFEGVFIHIAFSSVQNSIGPKWIFFFQNSITAVSVSFFGSSCEHDLF